MKKVSIIILIVIIVALCVFWGLNSYFHRDSVKEPTGLSDQKHYKILYMSATKNSLNLEYFFILDSNEKVIETRISETGSPDKIAEEANLISKFTNIDFDLVQTNQSFIYSTTSFNDKTIDEVKSNFNDVKESVIKNIEFKEI